MKLSILLLSAVVLIVANYELFAMAKGDSSSIGEAQELPKELASTNLPPPKQEDSLIIKFTGDKIGVASSKQSSALKGDVVDNNGALTSSAGCLTIWATLFVQLQVFRYVPLLP